MQAKKLVSTLAVAAAALISSSSVAAAADPGTGGVSVQPSAAEPGKSVTIYDGAQCKSDSATATSDAFTDSAGMGSLSGMLGGNATIANVTPGDYDVTVSCASSRRWKHKKCKYHGKVHVNAPKAPQAQAPKPQGAVKTGLGGATMTRDTSEMAGGAALLAAAAAAAGAVAIRRRSGDQA